MEKEEKDLDIENIDIAVIAEKLEKGYHIDYEILANPNIVKSLIEDYNVTDVLKRSPLRRNEEFVLSMVRYDHLVIKNIPELNQNSEFMLKAVDANKQSLALAADELLQNSEFMVEVIARHPGIENRLAVAKSFMENPENENAVKDRMFDIKCEELHHLKEEKRKMGKEEKELDEKIERKRAEIAQLRGIDPKEGEKMERQ